jgi:hypothetical protein
MPSAATAGHDAPAKKKIPTAAPHCKNTITARIFPLSDSFPDCRTGVAYEICSG